jgi:hypothetical protein
MLPASGCVNKRLDKKEESTNRRDKERKAWEKHKIVNEYLKNKLNQKDNTVRRIHRSVFPLTPPTNPNLRRGISQVSSFPLCGSASAKQDSPTFLLPQRAVARCHLERASRPCI